MNLLKKLAGETAVYGISSIVGRMLNYLLVPLYTTVFMDSEYGVVTKLYAYVAFFNIVYTYGMETAFFRFASKGDLSKTYQMAASLMLVSSTLITAVLLLNAQPIANYLGQPDQAHLVTFLGIILYIDAIAAIPFARLRLENKPMTFAIAKLGAIVFTIFLNLMFLLLPYLVEQGFMPSLKSWINLYYRKDFGVGYVFLANLLGNALILLFLRKYFMQIRLQFSWDKLKPLLIYGLPIFLMGLAGIANEQADKLLIPALLPPDFYEGTSSMGALGIYGASFKLSIFMLLAIQAFRYAGEPFFFSQADNREAPELFAKVLYYFVITCTVILVTVSLNLDLLGKVFLRQAAYREALFLVPILLFGKLLFGIYVNISIWFKLVDKTLVGTYISLIGATITILANIVMIPLIGYTGSAIASVLCYGSMAVLCYYWGRKHFPIPYHWKGIFMYLVISLGLIYAIPLIQGDNTGVNNLINLMIPLTYIGAIYLIEKRNLYAKTT